MDWSEPKLKWTLQVSKVPAGVVTLANPSKVNVSLLVTVGMMVGGKAV